MQVGPSEESVSNFPLSKGDWAPRLDFLFSFLFSFLFLLILAMKIIDIVMTMFMVMVK